MAGMTWTAPLPESPDFSLTSPERRLLEDLLDWHRSVLLRICGGLTAEQMATRALPPSNLTLLGLVRHMAKVERIWFRQRIGRQPIEPLYGGPGAPEDFADIDASTAQTALEELQEECRQARAAAVGADLDDTIDWRGQDMSVRMIYLHMIGEYARHNGHADLLREQLDGVTGR
jgi:uncharacterized damage-inducible protein DinB